MTLRSALRTNIRDRLNDNASTKIWADALINTFINEAIRRYGRELPKHTTGTLTAVADQEAYTLPTDLQTVVRVTQPDDVIRYLETPSRTSQGDVFPVELVDFQARVAAAGQRPAYWTWGGTIYLDPAPSAAGSDQNITLWYLANYTEPSADGDTLATPAADDDLLIKFAMAEAMDYITGDEAKRQRFERQTGTSAIGTARYLRSLAEAEIKRRRNKLRQSTLEPI